MLHRDVTYIRQTNLDDYMMTACMLVKAGFGSLAEIQELDTEDFLDLVEFMQISNEIEKYQIDEAKRENGNS